MNKKSVLLSFCLCISLIIVLTSCQSLPAPAAAPSNPTQALQTTNTIVSPTDTPEPTPTAIPPTEIPTIEPTPTPEGQLFRDDFSGPLLAGWTWQNEIKNRWSITKDGWLQIVGKDEALLYTGKQNNLLCRALPEGDVAISSHIISNPDSNFQAAAIYLYQNTNNYVTINRGYCDLPVCGTGGNGFYMDYKVNGAIGGYRFATSETDVYLRLERKDGVLSGYYALKPEEWQRLGRFSDVFELTQVCLGAANSVDVEKDIVGLFDYFEITTP